MRTKFYNIKKRRERLGLTLQEVATACELTGPGVRLFEAGMVGNLETRERLAMVLEISLTKLMTKTERRLFQLR